MRCLGIRWSLLGLVAVSCGCARPQPVDGNRETEDCGILFTVGGRATIERAGVGGTSAACHIIVRQAYQADPDTAYVSLYIYDAPWDSIAEEAGFEPSGDGWIVRGRLAMPSEAIPIAGNGWTGFEGLGETPKAVIGGGANRAVAVEANAMAEDLFREVIGSLRFARTSR